MKEYKGNIKSRIEYEDNIITQKTEFTPNGKISKSTLFKYNWETIIDYDKCPREHFFIVYNDKKEIESKTLTYISKDDLVIKKVFFNSENKITATEEFDYDNSKRLIKEINNGIVICFNEYFDQQLKKTSYNSNSEIINTYIVDYDSHGNEIMWRKYDAKNKLYKLKKYHYNDLNQLVKKVKYKRFNGNNYSLDENSLEYDSISKDLQLFNYNLFNDFIASDINIDYLDDLTIYEYDTNGNCQKKENYIFKPSYSETSLTLWEKNIKEYNVYNDIVSDKNVETKQNWTTFYLYNYLYDAQDRIIRKEEKIGTSDDVPFRIQKYKYNDSGILIEHIDDYGTYSRIDRYDEVGNLIYSLYNQVETKVIIEYY